MRVPRLPVADGQDLPQRPLRLERRLRADEPEAVGDAVDVHVDADRRQVEANRDRQVRRLASDPRQLAERLDRARQNAAELLAQDARQLLQVPRLVVVEPDGIDELLDLGDGNWVFSEMYLVGFSLIEKE